MVFQTSNPLYKILLSLVKKKNKRQKTCEERKKKEKTFELAARAFSVRSMTGKERELADMMERRRMVILRVQETKWKSSKVENIQNILKLFCHKVSQRNRLGSILKEQLINNVLEVKGISDRIGKIKLELEGERVNIVSAYTPQMGCNLKEKKFFE